MLAAQLRASMPNRTAWIAIYPMRLDSRITREMLKLEGLYFLPTAKMPVYRVRLFEIDDALRDTFFAERDMHDRRSFIVVGDDALTAKLRELEVPIDALDSPRIVGYPA